ncbi:hypothetical protein SAG0371_01840 [Streptococcus agalactiae GB00959]|nr:hypothetical protein SAG0371_01840 [Streptococcus agalactiae GB00959]
MNQEKKRLNLIGLILLAQAIVLSLATTLFAEILQNDVWIGIASTLIALLIPCFFMGFKNLKKHLTATHHTITFTTILFLLSIIYTTNNIVSTIWDAVLNHLNIMESESQNYDATFSILMISYSVVVGPFFEEVLYRGIVLNLLSKYGKWFAIITSGILFGLMHQDISQLLTTSIAGIIMGFIAYHYSFKVALLLHICNNFIVEIFTQLSTVNELYGTYFENILDFLRNKIWYNSSMNYEASKQLTDVRFKRLVGVQRTTFEEMLAVLKTAYQRKHAKGGRTPKLSLEDLLMATLQYMREYRTYEQIAADFGIHESNLIRRSQWVESTLIQSGFTISKTHLSAEDTVIVDATEVKINRPKKIN